MRKKTRKKNPNKTITKAKINGRAVPSGLDTVICLPRDPM